MNRFIREKPSPSQLQDEVLLEGPQIFPTSANGGFTVKSIHGHEHGRELVREMKGKALSLQDEKIMECKEGWGNEEDSRVCESNRRRGERVITEESER